MTVWAPVVCHGATTPTCHHVGKQVVDSDGVPVFDDDGNPKIGRLVSVRCTPECEKYLRTRFHFQDKPVLRKPPVRDDSESEDQENTPSRKGMPVHFVGSPGAGTLVPLGGRRGVPG